MNSNVQKIVKSYYDKCVELNYEVVGVFLFGSQNYECDTPSSDVDCKAIVIPHVEHLLLSNKLIHETIQMPQGEITIFDIRAIHEDFKKQNINFLEILFTEYKVVNPRYEKLYAPMFYFAETIANMNPYKAVCSINGNFMNKYKKIFHEVESNSSAIKLHGYDNKALADCFRYKEFLERYIAGVSYQDLLVPVCKDTIVRIKTVAPYLSCEAKELAENMKFCVDKIYQKFIESHEEVPDTAAMKIVDDVKMNCIKAYLNERCYKEQWPILSY